MQALVSTDPMQHGKVKVGISDGYMLNQNRGHVSTLKIVDYHKIDIATQLISMIQDNPGIEIVVDFRPMKTCNQFKSCWECLTHLTDFNCIWCPGVEKCSDNGLDRNHQVSANVERPALVTARHGSPYTRAQIAQHLQFFSRTGWMLPASVLHIL